MSAQHTPGPWQIKRRMLDLSEIIAVGDADGWFVADCHTTTRPVEEVAANARLIAAAPELLATCEALAAFTRDLLKLVTHDQIKEAKLKTRMLKLNDQAFNAMAKARGEL